MASAPPVPTEKLTVRLPVVLSLLSFVAAAGVSVGYSYSSFATTADVAVSVDKALTGHAAYPHSGAVPRTEFKRITDDLKDIKDELSAIKETVGKIKTSVAVLESKKRR